MRWSRIYLVLMNLTIVYEDERVLVVNKPYGVVVNRAESIKGETVQDWVETRDWFKKLSISNIENKTFRDRSGVCHRLDKETSGCLMIAKTPESMKYYLLQFSDRKITKEYKALVHGAVDPTMGEVVLPLRRSIFEREKWHVHYNGKRAVSSWEVLKRYDYSSLNEKWNNTLSLLQIGLKTGRTHQIRVHLSFLGWPIFSDDKYLLKKQSVQDRELLSHHFLHAEVLEFVDEFGKVRRLTAPLPDDCVQLLKSLKEQ